MRLTSSYIFLMNPFKKKEREPQVNDDAMVIHIPAGFNTYIEDSFPSFIKDTENSKYFRSRYYGTIEIRGIRFNVEFVIKAVKNLYYLDICVEGKYKAQIISCLEYIQEQLLNSGVSKEYIDIISYDAISEYYCNKMLPKLNTLERNLRKLMFNIYVLNFDKDYYQVTFSKEFIDGAKARIGTTEKTRKGRIKERYHVSNKEAEQIDVIQQFFYSLDYSEISDLFFTEHWTALDEEEKESFLSKNEDLSSLSDSELRNAIEHFSPKSDWDRFFKEKINIQNIKEIIDKIRNYRNSLAHFKFFYKNDYKECNSLFKELNDALVKAIYITEEIDFEEQNKEALKQAFSGISERLAEIFAHIYTAVQNFSSVFDKIENRINDRFSKIAGELIDSSVEKDINERQEKLFEDNSNDEPEDDSRDNPDNKKD